MVGDRPRDAASQGARGTEARIAAEAAGAEAVLAWHADPELPPSTRAVVLPGGEVAEGIVGGDDLAACGGDRGDALGELRVERFDPGHVAVGVRPEGRRAVGVGVLERALDGPDHADRVPRVR